MALPLLKYRPADVDIEIAFKRGPVNFACEWEGRVHDNVATSGLRERVFEGSDMIISFSMPAMRANEDLAEWGAFMGWALQGGQFALRFNLELVDWCNCVLDQDKWSPVRVGRGVYSAAFRFRVVPDAQMPASPAVVLQRFCGVAAEA